MHEEINELSTSHEVLGAQILWCVLSFKDSDATFT